MPPDPDPDTVERWLAVGLAAQPHLGPIDGAREFLAERIEALVTSVGPAARAADLVLAAACAAGHPLALAQVEAELMPALGPILTRLGVALEDHPEVMQRLRVALFVADEDGRPGIAGYRGRGELGAYLRAVAGKLALKHQGRRPPDRAGADDALELLALAGETAGARHLRDDAAGLLKPAFAEAVAALPPDQRTLLRQHYLDGVSAEALARLHQVHRATTTRWLEAAREALDSQLRRALGRRGVARDEVDDLVGLVASRIDLSLSRLMPP